MQLTLKGDSILENIILKSGKLPEPFLLTMLGIGVSQALIAASRLNLFNLLQQSPKTAAELAEITQCDRHGMQVLLESLTGFGYLKQKSDRYQLTKTAKASLISSGNDDTKQYINDWMRFCGDVSSQMALLEQDLKTGEVPNFHFTPQSDTCPSNYLAMLKGSGNQSVSKLIKWAKLNPSPQKLLDIGGGPAVYSIAFCQEYPELQAKIIDLPYAAQEGKKSIEQAGFSDRIDYIEGDLFEINWQDGYDVALLCNILHCFESDRSGKLINKTFQSLRPGGKIIIQDVFFPDPKDKLDSFSSLLSLVYYVTCGGRSWSIAQIQEWLTTAGFTNHRVGNKQPVVYLSAEKV
jgi:ubiquinone/menaquinone biosynthesis C-methylase UbiE